MQLQLHNDYSVPDSLHAVDKLTLVSIVYDIEDDCTFKKITNSMHQRDAVHIN